MQEFHKKTILLVLLAALALAGCSSKQQAAVKVYWPPPPAEPKMEWISTFYSADNFTKTEAQLRSEKFLGKPKYDYFRKPMGIAADSAGLVYVADMDGQSIWTVDYDDKKMKPYSQKGQVGLPLGLAVDSRDNLYVADSHGKQVLVFDAQRRVTRAIGAGEFAKPVFIALDESRDRIYVTDVLKHEVLAFTLSSGEKLFSFGGKGGEKGELYAPVGVAVDKEGRIFVSEQFNARIQVFDATGKSLYMFGKRGDRAFEFEGPRGLAFDSQGNLFVVETRKSAVLVFLPDGTPLTSLGGAKSVHPLGFSLPSAISIDAKDRIYITDGLNRRITIWQMLTPAYLAKHPLDSAVLREIEQRVIKKK